MRNHRSPAMISRFRPVRGVRPDLKRNRANVNFTVQTEGPRITCRLMDYKLAWLFLTMFLVGGGIALQAQAPAASKLTPNLASNIERPLRYRPDNGDFVIENGCEFFNRPLYGGNTAFRVDAGDKPEFSLYLPGRGGNLRFGFKTAAGTKWLHETQHITARYRPGEMLYEIRDVLLGRDGLVRVSAVALHRTEALVVRIVGENIPAGAELVFAYGGVNGKRGRRDGDIGTEAVPIGEYFQLKPEFCRDNRYTLTEGAFVLQTQSMQLQGLAPAGTRLALADANRWTSCADLLASTDGNGNASVVVGHVLLADKQPLYFSVQRLDATDAGDLDTYREVTAPGAAKKESIATPRLLSAFSPEEVPKAFAEAEAHFAALRGQIKVETPDPFLNAAVGALNVAADAVWDEPQQAIMHGAIAWRTKLLGWRGPYLLDALGWHDRARHHFRDWAARQNTSPIPEKLPPADEKVNLARNEAGLHSNGDISNSHYDMNLVYMDALFRHLRWTGDLDFAREMWPVIERHLAWERRLFRREFTTAKGEKIPLYEAYAAIWASDDLQYSGGGTAHASAYNYWHNQMAAQLAPLIGADPAPYKHEADLIARGMRELLWLDDHFAESKDWLGRQLVHPSAALWTFYHTMDAEMVNPREASAMAGYLKDRLPALPVRGPGVPPDLQMFASSDWMPYSWSINNVVMGENVHTALAFCQAGRRDDAFRLLKSSLVASMFMGICPGNVGSMNYLDVYRRESQRDFADGSGVLSRAIIEGLFGLRPDAFNGELTVAPQFPSDWTHASLTHPALELSFQRTGLVDVYTFSCINPKFSSLRLTLPADPKPRRVSMKNGHIDVPAKIGGRSKESLDLRWSSTGAPLTVTIEWDALPVASPSGPPVCGDLVVSGDSQVSGSMKPLPFAMHFNDRVTDIFQVGKYVSPRSPFVSLALPAQGIGAWAGHVNAMAEIDDSGLRRVAAERGGQLLLPNGVSFATPGLGNAPNILFVSQWDNYPREATIPLTDKAERIHLLMAGSTNHMQSRLDNGEVIVTYTDGASARLALRNPETWWPIEQDYFTDDYQFRINGPLPTRVDLKTGIVRVLDAATFKGQGRAIPGGAATVLSLSLDPEKELKSLTVRALANEVVIGLMAVTLERPADHR